MKLVHTLPQRQEVELLIRVKDIELPVTFLERRGFHLATCAEWPGYSASGETREDAARHLELVLDAVADDAIAQRRRFDLAQAGAVG